MAKRKKPRVFQMGFHRCGTTTLWQYFERNGLNCVHWDGGKLARTLEDNIAAGKPPLGERYADVDFFSEMEALSGLEGEYLTPFKKIEAFVAAYPDDVYILNTRRLPDWINSRYHHWSWAPHTYLAKFKSWMGPGTTDKEVVAYWRKEWHDHHAHFRKFFSKHRPYIRHLEFNIDTDGPHKLMDALPEWKLQEGLWRHMNRKRSGAYGLLTAREAHKRLLGTDE
jgi:hypothetical protein